MSVLCGCYDTIQLRRIPVYTKKTSKLFQVEVVPSNLIVELLWGRRLREEEGSRK